MGRTVAMFKPDDSNIAEFSSDRAYRYRLRRRWDDRPGVLWVMLNPSTADEYKNDNTLRRITRFSQREGFGALEVVNLYALVSTDPAGLWRAEDPTGPENDAAIALAAQQARGVIVAWGAGAPHPERIRTVLAILDANCPFARPLKCLGTTKDGSPRHPGRLAASTELELFLA